ncbi:hypothetical protein F4780DRAFT_774460 [Xylariomycetidae sp. FL0641]|nr:hypothetical protein F4780DRAFT_774460 [Xylariomycetidae sp. FL0641]
MSPDAFYALPLAMGWWEYAEAALGQGRARVVVNVHNRTKADRLATIKYISPYNTQVQDGSGFEEDRCLRHDLITISKKEDVQGAEADIVICDLVRTKKVGFTGQWDVGAVFILGNSMAWDDEVQGTKMGWLGKAYPYIEERAAESTFKIKPKAGEDTEQARKTRADGAAEETIVFKSNYEKQYHITAFLPHYSPPAKFSAFQSRVVSFKARELVETKGTIMEKRGLEDKRFTAPQKQTSQAKLAREKAAMKEKVIQDNALIAERRANKEQAPDLAAFEDLQLRKPGKKSKDGPRFKIGGALP